MSLTTCDVVILGGGPAGTATALSLLQHNPALTVLIVESSGYTGPRFGETLSPDARPFLEQIKAMPTFSKARNRPVNGVNAAWGSSELQTNESFFDLQGRGWHLDRAAFDAMLAYAAVDRGAMLYLNTRFLGCWQEPDQSWQLIIRTEKSAPTLLKPRFVVDATGRLAWFARQQGAHRVVHDQLTSMSVMFNVDVDCVDNYAVVETSELGWWYSVLLPNQQMIVTCFGDGDLMRQEPLKTLDDWLVQARKTSHTWGRVQKGEALGDPSTCIAYAQCLRPVFGPDWLAVGDSAATHDPLSGRGIATALQSGISASYAILDWFKGQPGGLEEYADFCEQQFEQSRAALAEMYALETRWPDSYFWQRRRGILVDHNVQWLGDLGL